MRLSWKGGGKIIHGVYVVVWTYFDGASYYEIWSPKKKILEICVPDSRTLSFIDSGAGPFVEGLSDA